MFHDSSFSVLLLIVCESQWCVLYLTFIALYCKLQKISRSEEKMKRRFTEDVGAVAVVRLLKRISSWDLENFADLVVYFTSMALK